MCAGFPGTAFLLQPVVPERRGSLNVRSLRQIPAHSALPCGVSIRLDSNVRVHVRSHGPLTRSDSFDDDIATDGRHHRTGAIVLDPCLEACIDRNALAKRPPGEVVRRKDGCVQTVRPARPRAASEVGAPRRCMRAVTELATLVTPLSPGRGRCHVRRVLREVKAPADVVPCRASRSAPRVAAWQHDYGRQRWLPPSPAGGLPWAQSPPPRRRLVRHRFRWLETAP